MTAVIEGNTEVDETEGQTEQEKADGRKERERDFSKHTVAHQELADFVNADEKFVEAGIAPVNANQVKAILALRTDFNDTPEKIAERAARKAEREELEKKFAGLTKEEIVAEKAAARAETQAAKLQKRVEEALAKAAALREGKDASGADLAAEIEASQNGSVPEPEADSEDEPKRRIGRRK